MDSAMVELPAQKQAEFAVNARESAIANSTLAAADQEDDLSEWALMVAYAPELPQISIQLIATDRARLGLDAEDGPLGGAGDI
jgi:hypothetical protein